ncbi:hypothetical protein DEA98_25700 [Brucella pseudogrignonensis]|nr:hypothetical protein [Brucella pseudogrignonensis]
MILPKAPISLLFNPIISPPAPVTLIFNYCTTELFIENYSIRILREYQKITWQKHGSPLAIEIFNCVTKERLRYGERP